jgi:predicted N-formylglutamate amidohydrolase
VSAAKRDHLIVSCEHGGNRLPRPFQKLLSRRFLETHRGWDPGALDLARDVARASGAPLFYSTVSRLLVELNRPLGHRQILFLSLPDQTREALLRRYYLPYWDAVEAEVAKGLARGRRVLHLSVHSFTPRFRGVKREVDVGLLFDPRRAPEARLCRQWEESLRDRAPRLRVRRNDPYRGTGPSLVQSLREMLPPQRYVGIQIEVNQKFPRGDARRWEALRTILVCSFVSSTQALDGILRPTGGRKRP